MLEATPPKCDDTVVLPLPPGGFHSSAASARSSAVSFRLANAGPNSSVASCYFVPGAPAAFSVHPKKMILPPAHAPHGARPKITVVWKRGRAAPSSIQEGVLVVATAHFEWRFQVRFAAEGDEIAYVGGAPALP